MKISFLFFFLFSFSVISDLEVRVNIFAKYEFTELKIQLDEARIFYLEEERNLDKGIWNVSINGSSVYIANGNYKFKGDHLLLIPSKPFTILILENGKILSRTYQGKLDLYFSKGLLRLVLRVPLEKYVVAGTYSELGDLYTFGEEIERKELFAAQEIVIRTFILTEKKRHSNKNFEFCDLTHCIHLTGIHNKPSQHPRVVISGKRSLNGYFHSTCGGYLSGPEVFWQKHEISSHYRRDDDGVESNCKNSPHFEWETSFSSVEFEEIIGVKNIVAIDLELKDKRVTSLKVKNNQREIKIIPISNVLSKTGKLHGWNKIKSNFFSLKKEDGVYRIKGHGLGHGIGLCQWGAATMAANGKTHKEILEFYFPNTNLKKYTD